MDTLKVLTPGPHICMTMGLHAHIESDFDQHNTTHNTA